MLEPTNFDTLIELQLPFEASNQLTHAEYQTLSGVISIKNKITELYAGNEAFYSAERKIPLVDLTEVEKANVKTGLLTVLLNENDNSIKGLLAECIKAVAEIDFPERFVLCSQYVRI